MDKGKNKEKSATSKSFRLQAKRLFLTFPQIKDGITKESAMESACSAWDLKWIVVAHEKHQDGGNHLHIALEFKDKFSTRKSDFANFICGSQGNYQPMKNMRQCLQYVIKDKDFCAHGIDPQAVVEKRQGSVSSWVAKSVLSGATMSSLLEEEPGFMLLNFRKVLEFQALAARKRRRPMDPLMSVSANPASEPTMRIASWIQTNLVSGTTTGSQIPTKSFKSPQLFICGPPNLGKTTLISKLAEYLRVYHVPTTEDFYDHYEDDDYDMAVIDEFGGQKLTYWLNEWLQGSVMTLRVKGGQVLKRKNLPTIILSNHTLERCYKNCDDEKLAPLRARLEIVSVHEFIDIEFNANHVSEDEEAA